MGGTKTPISLEAQEKELACWAGRGTSHFKERKEETWGVCVGGPTFPQLSSLCAGDIAEVVFDLCGDISECLDRLHLGTLLGYLLTPDGWGCLGHIFFWGGGIS